MCVHRAGTSRSDVHKSLVHLSLAASVQRRQSSTAVCLCLCVPSIDAATRRRPPPLSLSPPLSPPLAPPRRYPRFGEWRRKKYGALMELLCFQATGLSDHPAATLPPPLVVLSFGGSERPGRVFGRRFRKARTGPHLCNTVVTLLGMLRPRKCKSLDADWAFRTGSFASFSRHGRGLIYRYDSRNPLGSEKYPANISFVPRALSGGHSSRPHESLIIWTLPSHGRDEDARLRSKGGLENNPTVKGRERTKEKRKRETRLLETRGFVVVPRARASASCRSRRLWRRAPDFLASQL